MLYCCETKVFLDFTVRELVSYLADCIALVEFIFMIYDTLKAKTEREKAFDRLTVELPHIVI